MLPLPMRLRRQRKLAGEKLQPKYNHTARLRVGGLFACDDSANFDGAVAGRRDARGDGNGFVEPVGFDEEVTAELLLGFGKRAVHDRLLALADANRSGRSGGF